MDHQIRDGLEHKVERQLVRRNVRSDSDGTDGSTDSGAGRHTFASPAANTPVNITDNIEMGEKKL